ncbi:DUF5677 domain-containing protein [Cellulomonas sp. 179-A 9B4 NHS]|uniref:DUF5677 domain-containing protein n=1 Tax=Cellulomonas sp. 179-A 9B4 NHS TaxID=3142379 RepID=UPI0039A3D71F
MIEFDLTRETLRALVDEWHEAAAADSITMRTREHMLIGLTVYGLVAHVYTLTEAVMLLDEKGRQQAALPLVRQAIECGYTAVWLELAGYPAVLTMLREQTRQQRNVIDAFVRSGQAPNAESTARLNEELERALKSATAAGEKFEQRCRELVGGDQIYAMYRAASHTSHAGTAVVDLYLESARIGEIGARGAALRDTPKADSFEPWMSMLLVALVHATAAWSRIDARRTARTRMKSLAKEVGTTPHLQLSSAGFLMKQQRQREYEAWRKTVDDS